MNPYGVTSLIETAIALPILSLLAVLLRFYVRLHMRRSHIGVDDWLSLIAVVTLFGLAVMQVIGRWNSSFLALAGKAEDAGHAYSARLT